VPTNAKASPLTPAKANQHGSQSRDGYDSPAQGEAVTVLLLGTEIEGVRMHRVICAIVALAIVGCSGSATSTSTVRSSRWNDKALPSARNAERHVGGFTAAQRAAYKKGVQHIINRHQKVGSFTIAQVVDQQTAREEAREAAIQRDRERKAAVAREARERAAAAARAAREARIAAEERHLRHGEPDCLVLDDRTLHTESGEYTWYIDGKVQNRCDRDLHYVQVSIGFYDSAGNLANSGLDNVANLAAGQTWAFRKAVYESNTSGGTWRVEKITGF